MEHAAERLFNRYRWYQPQTTFQAQHVSGLGLRCFDALSDSVFMSAFGQTKQFFYNGLRVTSAVDFQGLHKIAIAAIE